MVKYHVDAENGIVVAKMEGVRYDAACIMNKCLGGRKMSVEEVKELEKKGEYIPVFSDYIMKDSFVGVARCHADDKFDEEVGKEIARKKMLIKYNKAKSDIVSQNLYKILTLADKLEEADDKIWDRVELLYEEIDKLSN